MSTRRDPGGTGRGETRRHAGGAIAGLFALLALSGVAQAQQGVVPPGGSNDEAVSPETVEDRDQDAVLDAFDQCPDQPEVYNGVTDEDGCPDASPPLGEIRGTITALIPLVGRRLQIVREAPQIIEMVSRLLREHPGVEQLTIEAHTDARGADVWNQRLSQARAEYVRDELVRRGIAASRLVAVGYGESCPLVPGFGQRVWSRNRRIAFFVTRSSDARLRAAPSACAASASAASATP
ncbi:MAG: OmpA family protein [Deltaproteobacteria bacterium]